MTLDKIYDEFYIRHVIYKKDYYKEIEHNDDINLEEILSEIGKKIEYNAEAQIYTDQVRTNIYNILSVIRNKALDIEMKEEVNRLITILNKTDKTNAKRDLYEQIYWRFSYFDKRIFQEITFENVLDYEGEINDFCAYDFPFLDSLIYDNDDEFMDKYYDAENSLFNLGYILVKRPEILNNENVKRKAENYLNKLLLKLKSKETLAYNPNVSLKTRRYLKTSIKKCLNMIKQYQSNTQVEEINKNDNSKLNIDQEQVNNLLDGFMVNALVFGNNYQKFLKDLDNESLIGLLDYLEIYIKENSNIYSDNIKKHLYEILDYYCVRINDPEVLNRIKELVNILNQSIGADSKMFYVGQYRIRYAIYDNQNDIIDFRNLEKLVCKSIENDPIFLEQLLNCSEKEFLSYNAYNEVSLSNLNYLVSTYPEILQEKTLLSKIYKLLDINKEIKQPVNVESSMDYEYQKRLKGKSKKLKKIVKNLAR